MTTPTDEQIERFISLTRAIAVIARKLVDSFDQLADTAEDLVTLWEDEQENGS